MVPYYHCHGLFFCRFYFFPPRGRVRPLVGITDYIRSTLLSDHIIDIYHYFIQDPYGLDCAVWPYLEILFQGNGTISLLPLFIVFLYFLICLPFTDECDHLLVSLITLGVLFWEIILSLFIMFFFSHNNGFISPSPLMIFNIYHLSLFSPHVWVWPLVFFFSLLLLHRWVLPLIMITYYI